MGSRLGYVRLENNDAIVSQLAQQDKTPWYSKPNLRLLYLLMLPACLGAEMTTGFDMSMMNGLQAVPSWLEYFHHPRSALLGFIVAMYSLGFVAAVPLVPIVVDKMGRRYSILFGSMTSMVGGIMQGFAINSTMLIVSRFIVGFSNVFCIVAAASLTGELTHPNERVVMSGLLSNLYDLGAIGAAGAIFGTFALASDWAWRIPVFLQIVPGLLQVTFVYFIPESPRWLVSKGKGKEAYGILVKYHAEGDETSDFVRAEYAQIKKTLAMEQKISETSWIEVFSKPGMRKRAIIAIFIALSVQWCGYGLTSIFLSQILDTIGVHDNRAKNIISLSRISWSLITGVAWSFIAPRYPRRWIFLGSSISLFVGFTAWTIANAEYSFTQSKVSAEAVLVLIFLYNVAFNGFCTMIFTFLAELFPFHMRAKGISMYQWCLRMAGFISQAMDPIGIETIGWRWYIVYCVWNAFQVVFIYFMFPETSGRTLEELAFLYEDDQETLTDGEVEALLQAEHRESGSYFSTVEDTPGRTEY